MKRIGGICLVATLAIAACHRAETPPVATAPQAESAVGHIDGIDWFPGDLDAAFDAAASQHKPVFLYWGAAWCPPCHDLKAHVFSRRDFQQKLRQFIPVYLDGDAPGAQRAGGEFQVLGYPTVVVLGADRQEIARIAGGMDLGRYADVLDLALENVKPLPEVLAALRSDTKQTLSESDCRRLAYNGWALDPRVDPAELPDSLQLAAARCPAGAMTERERLLVTAADFAAGNEAEAVKGGKRASPQLAGLVAEVETLLADPERSLAAGDALLYLGEDFFTVARHASPDRAGELQRHWFALMDAIEQSDHYADSDRLYSAAARLRAARALSTDEKIPDAVAARARTTLDAYLARSYDGYARAGVINSAEGVLDYLGDDARLRALLEEQLKVSRTPFYYMPDIADLDEKQGHKEQALAWLERGYRESQGPATRFQWGALYINGLLRMSPQDEPRIRTAALDVLGELEGPDRIHARARSRLDKLNTTLGKWATETGNLATLRAVAQRWRQVCGKLPESDPVRAECPGLVTSS